MAKVNEEQDPLASVAAGFRVVGAVLIALAVILGIIASIKHIHRLGIAVGIIAVAGIAAVVAAGQFNTSTYADRLGENDTPIRRKKSSGVIDEERFVRSTNAAEDHQRSEMIVENFRNVKKLPEVACKIKLDPDEACHFSTPARFEKASNGTFLVTSNRIIFVAQGIFNAADLKNVTQLIKYDSGAVGLATKRSLLPDVYDVAFPGELLTYVSLACMARGIESPPVEHV